MGMVERIFQHPARLPKSTGMDGSEFSPANEEPKTI